MSNSSMPDQFKVTSVGAVALSVTVVPDSGTGELAGLAGALTIRVVDKRHFYEFDYTID